jgi:hypothetical protein
MAGSLFKFESKNYKDKIALGNVIQKQQDIETTIKMVGDHMTEEMFFTAANLDKDWPQGRGAFISQDRSLQMYINYLNHIKMKYSITNK